jgi:hypothetical protein
LQKQNKRSPWFATLSSVIFAGITACSSLPQEQKLTPSEQVRVDNAVGRTLVEKLGFHVVRVHDQDVTRYLTELTQGLTAATPELKESPLNISVVENNDGTWRNYALPGIKIYLSVGFLKSLEFENELAAALSFELVHILKRNLLHHVLSGETSGQSPAQQVFVKPEHFLFTESEWSDSAEEAVRLLYEGRFDPRGLVSVLQRYQAEAKRSPIPAAMLPVILDRVYTAIVKYPPLRNPVVRSEQFVKMQKRIKKL